MINIKMKIKNDFLTFEQRLDYLTDEVFPAIDNRRRKGKVKSSNDTYKSFFGYGNKQGELDELKFELESGSSPIDCVLEIADLVYYSLRSDSTDLFDKVLNLAANYGLPKESALDACIIKYSCRNATNQKNDLFEKSAIASYLDQKYITNFDPLSALEDLAELYSIQDEFLIGPK
jgi:hypothetical protein